MASFDIDKNRVAHISDQSTQYWGLIFSLKCAPYAWAVLIENSFKFASIFLKLFNFQKKKKFGTFFFSNDFHRTHSCNISVDSLWRADHFASNYFDLDPFLKVTGQIINHNFSTLFCLILMKLSQYVVLGLIITLMSCWLTWPN